MSITIYMIISSVGFCFDFAELHVLESEYRFFSCYKKLKIAFIVFIAVVIKGAMVTKGDQVKWC